ncbi:MAG: multicopper oxidase family protein [Gammaproteobacteria bacterium]|nr:multicopper oxidase family protein [Gammaproteobacteria bacterium]
MKRRDFLLSAAAGMAMLGLPPWARGSEHPAVFQLEAREGTANLLPVPAPATPVWQYNRQTPGPVIRIRQGDELQIPFRNGLSQPTSVHWHGLRITNDMDGVPGMTQSAIAPGEEFLYRFRPPDAGTFWYHTHNRSWEQMARGLHGTLIVEEPEPILVDQDMVWVIDDWLIDEAGKIEESSLGNLHDWAHAGRLGNLLTVNGRLRPEYRVRSGERIRLRLINVANSRTMSLRFNGVTPLVIAVDGQPLAPVELPRRELLLASGQRMDLIVDMGMDPGTRSVVEFFAGDQSLTAASLVVDSKQVLRESPLAAPIRLADNPLNRKLDIPGARAVDLRLEGGAMGRQREAQFNGRTLTTRELIEEKKIWALNGTAGLPKAPLFSVKRGQSVVLKMANDNSWPHAMHIHGHHFRNLDNDTGLAGAWRDTLLLEAGEQARMAFVADNPGKWLIHCHMIEHQAGGMVTWFEVV